MTTVIFHDFPGLENSFLKLHDFPGCVRTLYITTSAPHDLLHGKQKKMNVYVKLYENNIDAACFRFSNKLPR